MLWLPDKKTRKALTRLKRRRRRRRIARILFFAFLLFALTTAAAPPEGDLMARVQTVTAKQQFDFIDWESQTIANEIGRRINPLSFPTTPTEQQTLMEQFLNLAAEIRHLRADVDQAYAKSGQAKALSPEVIALEQKLTALKVKQAELTPQIEVMLAWQIETILQEENFILAGQVMPPVAFRLINPPTALILSPRHKIENQHLIGLQPGLDNATRFELEAALDERGDVSSYISNIGGLGSYPTMVINTSNLVALIDITVHEWVHNYFFTFPTNLAWGYQTYPRLTTINETTATIVGKEVARKVITRFYPTWIDRLPPVDNQGIPIPRQPSEFDQTMRRVRQHVDQLLVEGKIEEAEAYMETERLQLLEKGYNLRKLNQAYFAFHGSYAFGPASIDPTGEQLRQLRAASSSLKEFLDYVAWLNSYADYLNWLTDKEIEK